MTMQEKIKQFFNIKDKNASQTPAGFMKTRPEEFALNVEIFKEISPESPPNVRLKVLRRLSEELHGKRMEDDTVAALWNEMRDLLETHQPQATRQAAFAFLKSLIQSQYDWLYMMRAEFFKLICHHRSSEDLEERMELLEALSKNGREIEHFEDEIGPFVMKFTSLALSSSAALVFLRILINLFKFHSVYLNKEIVKHVVWIMCHYACHTASLEGVMLFLQVLEAIIAFSYLPSDAMECMVVTMCRTVNVEKFSLPAWKLVRNLLGTHLGHSGVYIMCALLENREFDLDVSLLRGAVFYIGMCLWGSQKVSALKFTHPVVLPYLLQALQTGHQAVCLEVILSIQRLARKCGEEMQPEAWDLVLEIMDATIDFTESDNATAPDNIVISGVVHEIISIVEELQDAKMFTGCEKTFYRILARCTNHRPDSSVLRLIEYLENEITPVKSLWLTNLLHLVELYFRREERIVIRLKVLEVITKVLEDNRQIYEDEIVERIILPSLSNIERDEDAVVRNSAVTLLVDVAKDCGNKSCIEILEILTNISLSPFTAPNLPSSCDPQPGSHAFDEIEFEEVRTAISGLIVIFETKLYTLPSISAITAYKSLVKYLELQYNHMFTSKYVNAIRIQIFETLLKLRANERRQLGLVDKDTTIVNFSRYLICSHGELRHYGAVSPPPISSPTLFAYPQCVTTEMSLEAMFNMISFCLHHEKDWTVLRVVLLDLPNVLQNKTLLLSAPGVIGVLCGHVCSLLADRNLNLPESLRNAPVTLSRSEFNMHVYPIQVALVSYHKYLETNLQVLLVTCLKKGLSSKSSRACIVALTVCILEMSDTMYKLLPDVLLALSKISATLSIAIPILEFLSTLIRLPKLYASFVQDQYMSIFAIALPYTNPFRFNHYTVSLAHHVIAMWFIKCKLPFRKEFGKFVVKGLKNNVIVPFDEGNSFAELRRVQAGEVRQRPEMPESLVTFHKDLTETCIDLLTRYTFACLSTLPKRSRVAQFLLTSGQSLSWILGNAVITVTTSGCSVRSSKNGMCEKCYMFCKGSQSDPSSEGDSSQMQAESETYAPPDEMQTRRRHRSAAIRSMSAKVQREDATRSKDDLQLSKTGRSSITGGSGDASGKTDAGSSAPDSRICSCWCQGWAEIMIRRPTGNTSWVMRIQNQLQPSVNVDFPLSDVAGLLFSYHLRQKSSETAATAAPPSAETTSIAATSTPQAMHPSPVKKHVTKFGHERIDSESLDENETESLAVIQQLIPKLETIDDVLSAADDISGEDFEHEAAAEAPVPTATQPETAKVSAATKSPEKASLKKSNSSPDLRAAEEEAAAAKIRQRNETAPDPHTPVTSAPPSGKQTETLTKDGEEKTSASSTDAKLGDKRLGGDSLKLRLKQPEASTGAIAKNPLEKVSPVQTSAPELKYLANWEEKPVGLTRRATWVEHNPPTRFLFGPQSRQPTSTAYTTPSVPSSPLPPSQASSEVNDLTPIRRDRGHTISVMSPVRHKWLPGVSNPQQRLTNMQHQGIEPRFVFMQLFYSFRFGATTDRPILLPKTEAVDRAIKVLDRIPPYDTHKIGVIYVGLGQANNEAAILGNEFGSVRYVNFLHGIGHMVRLQDVNPKELYLGGLELTGQDGKFAYVWQDDVMQVIYHIATLMPSRANDPNGNQKKLHVGNDFVTIVYNDSGEEFKMGTIKGQLICACVIIKPLDRESNLVTVKTKPELVEFLGNSEPIIVSDHNLATLTRQLALHANLASMILMRIQRSPLDLYASNWLERLRQIRRMREKRLAELPPVQDDASPPQDVGWSREMDDFTKFV